MSDKDYVTKGFLRETVAASEKRVVDSISEVVQDALQLVSGELVAVRVIAEHADDTATRIESKLDPTIDQVDDNEGRLKQLELNTQPS